MVKSEEKPKSWLFQLSKHFPCWQGLHHFSLTESQLVLYPSHPTQVGWGLLWALRLSVAREPHCTTEGPACSSMPGAALESLLLISISFTPGQPGSGSQITAIHEERMRQNFWNKRKGTRDLDCARALPRQHPSPCRSSPAVGRQCRQALKCTGNIPCRRWRGGRGPARTRELALLELGGYF